MVDDSCILELPVSSMAVALVMLDELATGLLLRVRGCMRLIGAITEPSTPRRCRSSLVIVNLFLNSLLSTAFV